MASAIPIHLPADLLRAVREEQTRRGLSFDQTVVDLLEIGLGKLESNGLGKLAGSWTKEELEEFLETVAITRQIDEDMWQ